MATHRAARRPKRYPPWIAYTSVVLGVIGCGAAFLPPASTITGIAAAVGMLIGLVGIWLSRQVLSGVGVVLCGTAVMLTVVVQYAVAMEVPGRPMVRELVGVPASVSAPVVAVSDGC